MTPTTTPPHTPAIDSAAGMKLIGRYFPELTDSQRRQFEALGALYDHWNGMVNVISRKDIGNLYGHHILHSLAIAQFLTPQPGTEFMDLGTGGGFPGIPLAIMWPQCSFHLIDRIGKKVNVARQVAHAIGLDNVTFQHGDAAECRRRFDYVVSRAVTDLDKLLPMARRSIAPRGRNKLPNGLICLKGGDLRQEIIGAGASDALEVPLSDWFAEEFFATKKLIYKPL